jgi:hypothetical protein
MKLAQEIVRDALRSQGSRIPRSVTDALTAHLMAGGSPAAYGERFAQMQLQIAGLLITESEKRSKSND